MIYSAQEIAKVVCTDIGSLYEPEAVIIRIEYDTRVLRTGEGVLFVALEGNNRSGLSYIHEAYKLGVRNFLLKEDSIDSFDQFDNVNWFGVKDPLQSLQDIAAFHRNRFDLTTIAITGSNGKTIVKDWLFNFISRQWNAVKSPKSYNSQIGVPLSLTLIHEHHQIGIFEAGISRVGEMHKLARIIHADLGIMTNLGDAHDQGFVNREEKLKEKCQLFNTCKSIVFCADHDFIRSYLEKTFPEKELISWSTHSVEAAYLVEVKGQSIDVQVGAGSITFHHPLNDHALIEDLIHVLITCLHLGLNIDLVKEHLMECVYPLSMRLEVEDGRDGTLLINDAYNADFTSLQIALQTLHRLSDDRPRMLILSDIPMQHVSNEDALDRIHALVVEYGVNCMISVGGQLNKLSIDGLRHRHFLSTEDLLTEIDTISFNGDAILIKGARSFQLERVFERLSKQSHSATLQIDLTAIGHNLAVYQSYLKNDVQLMPIIKASAYGTGGVDIARYLEQKGVAYLGVAFPDEGIVLRNGKIKTPILVLNPDMVRIRDYIAYDLDVVVYSMPQLKKIVHHVQRNPLDRISIHIELDTGMHRLGFYKDELEEVRSILEREPRLELVSIFSHLAGSESFYEDDYTKEQFRCFDEMCRILPEPRYKHILNTAGIVRFPDHQYSMVRMGLGLYGIDTSHTMQHKLLKAHSLKASIIQLKGLKDGEKAGYNQSFTADRDCTIAVVNIGYADGLMRASGNCNYTFLCKGKSLEIIGNICMDLTICLLPDGLNLQVGDQVTIFGPDHPIEELARINQTIPYEILSRIAPRVKRKYVFE